MAKTLLFGYFQNTHALVKVSVFFSVDTQPKRVVVVKSVAIGWCGYINSMGTPVIIIYIKFHRDFSPLHKHDEM